NVVPGTRGHCGLVEFIDLFLIFGLEAPMNGRWIRLPLLYPEERPFAITKSPQIRMTVFALVRHEEFDIKRLQGRLIEASERLTSLTVRIMWSSIVLPFKSRVL